MIYYWLSFPSYLFDELAIQPNPVQTLLQTIKHTFPWWFSIFELTLVKLSIWKCQLPVPFFFILHEITWINISNTFVAKPVFILILKIFIVEGLFQQFRLIIEDLPPAVELIHKPHSFIS